MRKQCSVLIVLISVVCGQYAESPCPGVFDYESDGSGIYGRIVLQPGSPVSQLELRTNFTVAARLLNNYVGRIEAESDNLLLQKYNRGSPIVYRVHFPVTSPLPKLTAISVNGETICYGQPDVPRPNQYVTTLSLQHTSFLQGGSPVYNNYQPQQNPQSALDFVGQYGDAQVYQHTWNNGYFPYYIVSTARPYKPTSRPSYENTRPPPTYNNHDQYERPDYGNYEDRTQRPAVDRNQNQYSPYEPPVTRPTKPTPDTSLYYPQQHTTQPPRRPSTQRPRPRPQPPPPQAPTTSNSECGVVDERFSHVPLIYGGNPYNRGDLPWLVAIYKIRGGTLSFICGGTLLSDRHVVTAAHCLHQNRKLLSNSEVVVKVGVHNLNDWDDEITVTRTLVSTSIHEYYNTSSLENDIAIFTFNKRVEFNAYIKPACLWHDRTELNAIVGSTGVVAGWGDQGRPGTAAGEPHMVRIPIVSTAECRASKPQFHFLTSHMTLCAGDRNGDGPCNGDSGGGLYLHENGKWRIRGVVSVSLRPQGGDSVCNLDEYIIFTDTAQYLTWIRRVLAQT